MRVKSYHQGEKAKDAEGSEGSILSTGKDQMGRTRHLRKKKIEEERRGFDNLTTTRGP